MIKCKYDDWEWRDWAMKVLCQQDYSRCTGQKCHNYEPCECEVKKVKHESKHKVKVKRISNKNIKRKEVN